MQPILPPNLSQAPSAFADAEIEFLVVGAFAVAVHDVPRATGDLDLWVRPSAENAMKVFRTLAAFGAPLERMEPGDFTDLDITYQFGVPPEQIDVMTSISGVSFDEAWPGRLDVTHEGRRISVIGADALIANKLASGRPKDLRDADAVRRAIARRRSSS
jgi:hypothetical protein